ncbi:MAG: hypothetical protein BA874_05045 [Desulfuromonadales bacterium C00003068]|jgi:hypothetical protein|nr:MAG: hypothetical protein BA874_05045 [Desulfuromonadales bacterium C00003068]
MEGHFSGGCHCGKVIFEIDGKILNVVNCHCSICRKANGGAFSSYLVVPDEAFVVVKGQELLTCYTMTEKAEKRFCKICGAPVFNRNKLYSGVTVVPLGCLDDLTKISPKVDIYCADMLPWVTPWPESKRYETGLQ